MTLWSQQGSSVFRGNLLAIPVKNSMIYFEPIFLQSSSKGSLPQLKRTILAQGDRLTMEKSVDEALEKLFKPAESDSNEPEKQPQQAPVERMPAEDLKELNDIYQQAKRALEQGSLKRYADQMQEFERKLNEVVN
ncbi:MAG: UPF0182 family protein, partial [Candidatus Magasanikbacteria bacterium]